MGVGKEIWNCYDQSTLYTCMKSTGMKLLFLKKKINSTTEYENAYTKQ